MIPKRRVACKRIDGPLLCGLLLCVAMLAELPVRGASGGVPSESETWFEVRTPTFVLIATVHEQRAVEMARELEAFRHVLEAEVPGLSQASRPVAIFAFDSRRSLKRFYPAAPRGVGGVFLRRGTADVILVDAGTSLRQQHAYHEYVHFRLRGSFPALPAWLNEGLAYYYQTFRRTGDGNAQVGAPVPGLRQKRSTPLSTLLQATASSEHYATRSFARQSWLVVHYLLSRSDEDGPPLAQLLSGTGDGGRGDGGLTEILGMSLPEIEVALNRYAGNGSLKARRIRTTPRSTSGEPAARRLEYSDVLVRAAELAEAVGEDSEWTRTLFDDALKRSPKNTRALLGSARGLQAAGDLAGALARVDYALEHDPTNVAGFLLRGEIAMSEFSAWRQGRPDGAAQVLHAPVVRARHAFQHAIQLDPALLAAVRGYARTFLFDPETRQPGIEACLGALADRNDLDLALTLVELYSDDGDRQSAHAVRRQRVLPMRGLLEHHGTREGPGFWMRVEARLAHHDMLLAERLYESRRHEEAIAVLRGAREWATGEARDQVIALLADMAARLPQ